MRISLILFILALLSYVATAHYTYRTLWCRLTPARGFKRLYYTLTFAVVGYMLLLLAQNKLHTLWINDTLFVWSLWSYLFCFIPSLLYTLISLLGRLVRRSRSFDFIGVSVAAVVAILMVVGVTVGRTHIITQQVVVTSPLLPKGFEGYRLAQISDIHLRGGEGDRLLMEQLAHHIAALDVDVVLFTGDLVNGQSSELDPATMEIMRQISGREGTYSVLGNHDYGYAVAYQGEAAIAADVKKLVDKQEQMGWRMLNNSYTLLHHEGDTIALIGVENWGEPPFSQYGNLAASYPNLTDPRFKILLSHNPVHWSAEVLSQSNIALTLAGHTHAMQAKLPLTTRGISPARWAYKNWEGLYTSPTGQHLYVNQGIGYVGVPMRLGNAFPAVTVIELRREE